MAEEAAASISGLSAGGRGSASLEEIPTYKNLRMVFQIIEIQEGYEKHGTQPFIMVGKWRGFRVLSVGLLSLIHI